MTYANILLAVLLRLDSLGKGCTGEFYDYEIQNILDEAMEILDAKNKTAIMERKAESIGGKKTRHARAQSRKAVTNNEGLEKVL